MSLDALSEVFQQPAHNSCFYAMASRSDQRSANRQLGPFAIWKDMLTIAGWTSPASPAPHGTDEPSDWKGAGITRIHREPVMAEIEESMTLYRLPI